MKKNAENRQELYRNIVTTFLNASRGHGYFVNEYGDPVERLGELAMLLYFIKNNHLKKMANVPEGKNVIVLQAGPTMIAGDMERWLRNNIVVIGLVRDEKTLDSVSEDIIESLRQSIRLHQGQSDLISMYDLIKKAELKDEEYLQLLEYAEEYMLMGRGRMAGEFINPKSLGEVLTYFFSSLPKSVFDPFVGSASFATCLAPDVKFVGKDINPTVIEYAHMKLLLWGGNFECVCEDTVHVSQHGKYDAIVTFPPIGLRMEGTDIVEYVVNMFKTNTTDTGEMLVVLPYNVCESSQYAALRKYLTKHNYLDDIVLFPNNYLYGTSVSTILVHLRKGRSIEDEIRVVNVGEYAEEVGKRVDFSLDSIDTIVRTMHIDDMGIRYIHLSDIVENEFNWSPLSYVDNFAAGGYRGSNYVKLMSVLERVRFSPCVASKRSILNLRQVSSPFEDIPEIEPRDNGRYIKVTEPVLAVGYTEKALLLYIEASPDKPVYMSDKEILYRCSNIVSPKYLAHVYSRTMKNKYSFPSIVPSNRAIDSFLRNQMVGIPSYPEQMMIVEDAYQDYVQKEMQKSNMAQHIEQLKNNYVQEIRSRKHNMRPYLREMKSSNDLAQLVLSKAQTLDEVRPHLMQLLKNMELSRKGLSEIIDHLSQIDKFGNPEFVHIHEFFENYIRNYKESAVANNTRANISYCHSEPVDNLSGAENVSKENSTWGQYVLISPYDFKRMVDCIVENAHVHGFDGNGTGHFIGIVVNYDYEELEISFSNDGKPFPEGFDINRYGLLGEKAGPHAGTGDGGHQVVSIANHYGGYVSIESTKQDDPNPQVTITVHLPIADKDWEDERAKWYEDNAELLDEIAANLENKEE